MRASAGAGVDRAVVLGSRRSLVDVEAGAGHVGIHLPRGDTTYRVEADSGPGDQRVAVATDAASDHVIRAKAAAGDVEVGYRAA